MDLDWAKEWIEKQTFVYAKSYAKTLPHHYTTRDRCDEFYFEQFLKIIREFGKLKAFHSKQYLYLEIGEYEYWEMGRPIKAVQVLNKAKINDFAKYRIKMPTQIEEETIKSKFNMREWYLDQLLKKNNPNSQEQKQIDFLLNSERRIHGGGFNIIDHSSCPVIYEK